VSSLDSRIDDLYKVPLAEFVPSRSALAGTLKGDEARVVKALKKPTVVPWVVNQLYWHARPAYDRIRNTGNKVRAGQIAALKGRSADVKTATDAHRKAMTDAVREALRLAAAAGVHPDADELSRTIEAVSLAQQLPEPEGRLTKPLRPAGFEALAGVAVRPLEHSGRNQGGARAAAQEKARAAAERRKQQALDQARKAVEQAREIEEQARAEWEAAKQTLKAAELELSELE
jgi:hypothetical protein